MIGLRTSIGSWVVFLMAWHLVVATPQTLRYQGQLSDSAGVPLTGSASLTFAIYDALTGGTQLWTETLAVDLSATGGRVDVVLGQTVPIGSSLFAGADRWLEISVDGTPLLPRQTMASVPFSHNASLLSGMTLTALLDRASHTGTQPPASISPQGVGSGLDADRVDGLDADALVARGSAGAISREFLAGEDIGPADPLYYNPGDGRVYLTSALAALTADNFLGFSISAASALGMVEVQYAGIVDLSNHLPRRTVSLTDGFNRANSSDLGNGWQEFEETANDIQISSNRLGISGTRSAIAGRPVCLEQEGRGAELTFQVVTPLPGSSVEVSAGLFGDPGAGPGQRYGLTGFAWRRDTNSLSIVCAGTVQSSTTVVLSTGYWWVDYMTNASGVIVAASHNATNVKPGSPALSFGCTGVTRSGSLVILRDGGAGDLTIDDVLLVGDEMLCPGVDVLLADEAGGLAPSAGTVGKKIGRTLSATEVLIHPD